jgi:hypothetical protein
MIFRACALDAGSMGRHRARPKSTSERARSPPNDLDDLARRINECVQQGNGWLERQTAKSGTDVVRQEDRAGERRRHSRQGQG